VDSGLSFGGIGCGKMEIFPNGTLDCFTNQNNWEQPKHTKTDNCLVEAGGDPLSCAREKLNPSPGLY